MPRRIHIESDDVLGVASTAMEITESITDLVHVPIASTVASLVSVVLKAAKVGPRCHLRMNSISNHSQDVKNNNDARLRLAHTVVTYLKALRPYLDAEEGEVVMDDLKTYLDELNK